jgi:hypothetical protein
MRKYFKLFEIPKSNSSIRTRRYDISLIRSQLDRIDTSRMAKENLNYLIF